MASQSAVALVADKMSAANIATAQGLMRKTVTSEAVWAAAVKVPATATAAKS